MMAGHTVSFLDKETQLVIRIETMHESSHKATLAWNIQALWSILLPYQGIKILLQFWGYQFVSINHQYPLAGTQHLWQYSALPGCHKSDNCLS